MKERASMKANAVTSTRIELVRAHIDAALQNAGFAIEVRLARV